MRSESDADYVIGLCDSLLKQQARRGHRFDFLRGDAGHRLPVGAYYQDLHLVVDYRDRLPSESVVPIHKGMKIGGLPRDPLQSRYEQRRRDVLPKYGLTFVEFSYKDFECDPLVRLRRVPQDIDVVRKILAHSDGSLQSSLLGGTLY